MMLRLAGVAASLAAVLLATGCSRTDSSSILGHWRAERLQVASLQLPIGPDIVIKANEISSPDADTSIPVKAIEHKGDETVLDLAYGLGLSFYFDGPDRMYVKVPILGRVYYRRVVDSAPVRPQAAVSSEPVASALGGRPVTAALPVSQPADSWTLIKQAEQAMRDGPTNQAETLLTQAEQDPAAHPVVDYDLAVIAARRDQTDLAIEHLSLAFKGGFRQFDLLDSTQDFEALKSDVRYQALVARYR